MDVSAAPIVMTGRQHKSVSRFIRTNWAIMVDTRTTTLIKIVYANQVQLDIKKLLLLPENFFLLVKILYSRIELCELLISLIISCNYLGIRMDHVDNLDKFLRCLLN